MRRLRHVATVLGTAAAAVLFTTSAAQAAGLRGTDLVAFVRAGNLFIATGTAAPVQVSTGGGYEWPRWAPATNPGGLAYLHDGDLFVAHYNPGSGLTGVVRVTTGADAGAAGWAPDGHRLAFADNNTGLLRIADINTTPATVTTVLDTAFHSFGQSTGFSALIQSTAVAWSPNGRWIAFRGGECLGIFDDCMSIIDPVTLEQQALESFSGGGDVREGFAAVPAWSPDSKKLYWTQQNTDPLINNGNTISKLQIWRWSPGTAIGLAQRWGRDGDSEIMPFPPNGSRFVLTVPVGNKSWVAESEGGVRTLLYQGYQPSWVHD